MYDWQIKPHRHTDLMQIFYVAEGSGYAEVDNKGAQLKSGDLLIVPQNCVHTFRWEESSNGYVLFIARPLIAKMERILGALPWAHDASYRFSTLPQENLADSLFVKLCHEYQSKYPHREILLENLLLSLFVWINRQYLKNTSDTLIKSRSLTKVESFGQLLDTHLSEQHSVDWYAQKLNITAPHLNSLCKKTLKQNALKVIHERLLKEAQRNLIYTGNTAAEIANSLGFSDPAYFNRFFKRKTGMTPKEFRTQRPE